MSALDTALAAVGEAAGQLFGEDPAIRSVGVGKMGSAYGLVAVRNSRMILPLKSKPTTRSSFNGIPVHYVNSLRDPEHHSRIPHGGAGSPTVSSLVPEQQSNRPLVCGLQIQNYDNDIRSGEIAKGYIIIGTIGCFVKLNNGEIAILSNNHVVAGENAGAKGKDRIQQPGNSAFTAAEFVATLTDFVAVQPSPGGATPATGNVIFNDVDAGVATLEQGISYAQSYLPSRSVAAPKGTTAARLGDKVHKVGRTTGLTFGTIKQVGTQVGPIPYAPGSCWFRNCMVIEGVNGTMFSDHGDSGSSIVRDDGMLVGLLFAGNGQQTYACDIGQVLNSLQCGLA